MLAILLVLGFIWDSGILKTDNDYWIVLYILMVVSIVRSSYWDYNGKKKTD